MPARFCLIRHGQTDQSFRFCGHSDPPLNEIGRKQANDLAFKLQPTRFDVCFSAPAPRSLETAKIIFQDRVPLQATPSLAEIHFGIWEGLSPTEVQEKYPALFALWQSNPILANIPGGEAFEEFSDRVLSTWKEIKESSKTGSFAVVSHGGPIARILIYEYQKPLSEFRSCIPSWGDCVWL